MIKTKWCAAALLFLLSMTCFAQGFLSQATVFDAYSCGNPPAEEKNPGWCSCYSAYLQASCELSGGSTESCSDASLRVLIKEFGGPEVVCNMIPNPDMTPALCQVTLTHYLDQC